MKNKLVLGLCALLILFISTGCGLKIKISGGNSSNEAKTSATETKSSNSSVVLYFSATGTTKKVAERIAKFSNSDIIEIIPKEKYTPSDLDYNSDCRANKEQNNPKARPEIENVLNIDDYDTVYLGYPIWWGTNPKIILTLLDTYDFTDKTIIPFCTSGSSDITDSVKSLRKYDSKLTIRDGKRFSTSDKDDTIKKFIEDNE